MKQKTGIMFNKELRTFDATETYINEIEPVADQLRDLLVKHRISGIFAVCAGNTEDDQGGKHMSRGFAAYFGDQATTDEQVIARMFLQHGMTAGIASLMVTLAKRTQHLDIGDHQLLQIVDALGRAGTDYLKKDHEEHQNDQAILEHKLH